MFGGRRPTRVIATITATIVLAACGSPEPRDLSTLVIRDSLYVDAGTGSPYSGPVIRPFRTGGGIELEGTLAGGTWDGELRVYHPNGRLRYMGSFDRGARCGAWTENADSTANESVYEQLVREIESLGLYPPCPER